MFNQILTLLSSKDAENGSFDEEENYMINHFKSALDKARIGETNIYKPVSKVDLKCLDVEEVKSVPFRNDTLVKLFSSE